ncbi:MAG TPA: dTMP kinase [Thermoplasmata archaeon]|nr:dTMP kinase [Thermoplasmata archaeon]
MKPRGRYIVLEGIDGAGKTGLLDRLGPALLQRGHATARFREPTDAFLRAEGTRLAQVDPLGAAFCFTVDRMMLRPEIERALDRGDIVLQDRSFYSTLAYQAAGLAPEQWRELERIERSVALEPDLVLLLDLPVAIALKRAGRRGPRDTFEQAAYLEGVRARFEALFAPPRWVRVDASGFPQATLDRALAAVGTLGL